MSLRKICATQKVSGVDMSRYQPNADFGDILKSGHEFAYIKATEGAFVDPYFDRHWKAAGDSGILRGAYHFFHFDEDPIAQAHVFLNAWGTRQGCLPPMLDMERPNATDRRPMSLQEALVAESCLLEIEKQAGVAPFVYGGPYFLQVLSQVPAFKQFPLWIAHYGVVCPLVPEPWDTFTIHQYSGNGIIAGDRDIYDFNYFNGTLDQLKNLVIK